MVLKTLKENGVNATKLIVETVPMIASEDWTKTLQENKVCVCVCVCGNRKQEALLLRKTPNIIFVFHVNVCVYVWEHSLVTLSKFPPLGFFPD